MKKQLEGLQKEKGKRTKWKEEAGMRVKNRTNEKKKREIRDQEERGM